MLLPFFEDGMVYSSEIGPGTESSGGGGASGDLITSIGNEEWTDQIGVNATMSERRPRDDDLSSAKLNCGDGKHVIAPS